MQKKIAKSSIGNKQNKWREIMFRPEANRLEEKRAPRIITKEQFDEGFNFFLDPVTQELSEDPVFFGDHPHVYDRASMQQMFDNGAKQVLGLRVLNGIMANLDDTRRLLREITAPGDGSDALKVALNATRRATYFEEVVEPVEAILEANQAQIDILMQTGFPGDDMGIFIAMRYEYIRVGLLPLEAAKTACLMSLAQEAEPILRNALCNQRGAIYAQCPLTRQELAGTDMASAALFENMFLTLAIETIRSNPDWFEDDESEPVITLYEGLTQAAKDEANRACDDLRQGRVVHGLYPWQLRKLAEFGLLLDGANVIAAAAPQGVPVPAARPVIVQQPAPALPQQPEVEALRAALNVLGINADNAAVGELVRLGEEHVRAIEAGDIQIDDLNVPNEEDMQLQLAMVQAIMLEAEVQAARQPVAPRAPVQVPAVLPVVRPQDLAAALRNVQQEHDAAQAAAVIAAAQRQQLAEAARQRALLEQQQQAAAQLAQQRQQQAAAEAARALLEQQQRAAAQVQFDAMFRAGDYPALNDAQKRERVIAVQGAPAVVPGFQQEHFLGLLAEELRQVDARIAAVAAVAAAAAAAVEAARVAAQNNQMRGRR